MKLNLYVILLFFIAHISFAQVVNIPDSVLKSKLVNYQNPVIDTNGDGEIQVSEAEAITELNLYAQYGTATIQDATGLEAFINLTKLNLYGHDISSINLTSLTSVEELDLSANQLSSIDLSQNIDLAILRLGANDLTSIDFSNNPNLEEVEIWENFMSSLDVSNNPALEYFNFFGNRFLTHVNIRNGNTEEINLGEGFLWTPNVEVVCVDDGATLSEWNHQQLIELNAMLSTNCDFDLANSNSISGILNFNLGAGCEDYTSYGLSNVLMISEDATYSYATLTNRSGDYLLKVEEGDFTTTVVGDFPAYFTINPNVHSSSFIGYENVDVKNFCMEATESVADLNISISGSREFQDTPNLFCFSYFVTVENMGTSAVDGEVSFQYDGNSFNLLDTSPATTSDQDGLLTFDISNLRPLESTTYTIVLDRSGLQYDYPFNVGDQIDFTAYVTPIANDITPDNNTYLFTQSVVSSYDPNDKNVMEGEEITLADAENYLHYTVRFQNTGNANADRVIITDTLSEKLEWTSLRMLSASHNYHVELEDEQILHFIFNNIDLTYEQADEEES